MEYELKLARDLLMEKEFEECGYDFEEFCKIYFNIQKIRE